MRRLSYLACALVAGACDNTTMTGSSPDLTATPPDMTVAADMTKPPQPDMTALPDMTVAGDMAMPDLIVPPDMTFTCTPNAFLSCMGNNAVYCNAMGDGTTNFDCGAMCVGKQGCGICTPGAMMCANNMVQTCTPQGSWSAAAACFTFGLNVGVCQNNMGCEQCTGAAYFCGDGMHYGTQSNTQYSCTNNVLGNPVACAFGCDAMTGKCRDLVPANQAAAHLANADTWTCTGVK